MRIIKGQEAICPDGLGRVVDYNETHGITVQTYIDDRSICWFEDKVELINPQTEPSYKKHEKAHIIMCNDFPEGAVLDDKDKALKLMDKLITRKYNAASHFPTLDSYRKSNYWRIESLDVV